ncbi:MAG: signal peptide peptidase SppA [Candidatus Dadabacteria bacterium]|nr:MAG: signal peptide peptidase SppA [Candidatus Dadabacteria bacterium]
MKEYFIWLAKFLTVLLVVFLVVPVFAAVVLVAMESLIEGKNLVGSGKNVVAVVELEGEIESSKDVVNELYKQARDKEVKGIVLRINSPGGAVGPSQDIYDAVRKIKKIKPVIASMGSVAASGGFYSALGASKIFCQPGTLTGSIGVILQVPNFSAIADKYGFKMVTVKSGKMKDVGNPFRGMKPEEKAFLESTVKKVHAQFVDAVVKGRGLPLEKVKEFADGRVIVGSDAKKLGLVDGFGGVRTAARAVFDELGKPLKENEYPELRYRKEPLEDFKKALRGLAHLSDTVRGRAGLYYLAELSGVVLK